MFLLSLEIKKLGMTDKHSESKLTLLSTSQYFGHL